ncbi:MAG: EscU/YscU/HrcU family type III secretion system export apparatus switch protein [Comamonadaceae bacterium]|nr:MAG: EscU/YscU/HrcU family type III secretion system export apparatus switch protein [Comamonadaceae bacterium]
MSGEKNKPPTEQTLKKAREDEGQTGASPEATAAVALLGVLFAVSASAGWMNDQLRALLLGALGFMGSPVEDLPGQAYRLMLRACLLLLPLAMLGTLAGVIGVAVQGGITMAFGKIQFKPESIDPVSGVGRIVSVRTLMEGLKIVAKLALMSAFLWYLIRAMLPLLVGAAARPPLVLAGILWPLLMKFMFSAAAFIALAGLLDYKLQKWLFIRDKRMSEEDIKRERKEQNGNPQMKQKQRELAREAAQEDRQGMASRPDVVLANPTHFAVALSYTRGQGVPFVTAKGEDAAAFALRAWAEKESVPVIEQPALARELYLVPVGQPIPAATYQSVAVILRWVDAIGRGQPGAVADAAT